MPPAHVLARRYAEALAALRAVHAFDAWLGGHWHDHCPPAPASSTASTDTGTGRTITWHDAEDMVIGYLPGEVGCFRVERDVALPDFPQFGMPPPMSHGADVVISAAMQEALPASEN